MARAMQHEIDHLNGILFLAHLSPLKREVIKTQKSKRKFWQANGNETSIYNSSTCPPLRRVGQALSPACAAEAAWDRGQS